MEQRNAAPAPIFPLIMITAAITLLAWSFFNTTKPTEEKSEPKPPAITKREPAAAAIVGAGVLQQKPPTPPPVPSEPHALIALGDSKSHLHVILNSFGGGVQQVVLNHFHEANRLGQPAKDDAGNQRKMHLIPGFIRPQYLYLSTPSDYPTITPNFSAEQFAAKQAPTPISPALGSVLSPVSYVLMHYPTKDDPARWRDPQGKINPDDDKYPIETLATRHWKVVKLEQPAGGTHEVAFESTLEAPYFVTIRKTFSLAPGDYDFKLKVDVIASEKRAAGSAKLRYQISGPIGMPLEGEWYTTMYRQSIVSWLDGTGRPRRDVDDASNIHYRAGGNATVKPGRFTYAAIGTQYFASALAIDDDVQDETQPWEYVRPTRAIPSTVVQAIPDPRREAVPYSQDYFHLFDISFRAVSKVFDPAANETITHNYAVYNGPMKVRLLGQMRGQEEEVPPETVERYVAKYHLDTLTDFHSPTWIGRRSASIGWADVIIFMTNIMHWLLDKLHQLVGSWGVSIIALTIVVRSILFIPSRRQQAANVAMSAKMASIKPEIDKLNEKYGDDPFGKMQAQRELFKKHNIQPMKFGGCLFVLLQVPILMGLYLCIQESVFFRLEPFLWFPNLAAPDMVLYWTEDAPVAWPQLRFAGMMSFLYLGPFFNVVPLLAVALFYVQQRLTMPPPTDDFQAQMQQSMKFALIFTGFFFYKYAAGLALYFIVGGLWSIMERKLVPKPDPSKYPVVPPPSDDAKNDSDAKSKASDALAEAPRLPGFFGRLQAKMEEMQRSAENQRQIRNDPKSGSANGDSQPRGTAGDRAKDRKNKKKKK